MKIFISTSSFAQFDKRPLILLRKKGISYTFNPLKRKLTDEEVIAFFKKSPYVGLLAGTEHLTKKFLESAPSLRVISRVGAGLDNVDLAAAWAHKVKVYNTPDVLTDAVAELTLAMILSSLRRLSSSDRNLHNKVWRKEMGSLFNGKTLGIIGFGKIGRRVAQIAKGFGTKIIFSDLRIIKSRFAGQVALDFLFKRSDIISIHYSGKDTLISRNEIRKMKKGVVIINTARGSALDEDALYEGLHSGKIGSAALDVYNKEPYSGRLCALDNCLLTPHIGSYAKESRIVMEIKAAENLLRGLVNLEKQ